jgi:hypothetical protein
MRVFDMIRLLVPELEPQSSKVHLANHNGLDDPLDVFLAGRFPGWQSYQAQKNFERQFVSRSSKWRREIAGCSLDCSKWMGLASECPIAIRAK